MTTRRRKRHDPEQIAREQSIAPGRRMALSDPSFLPLFFGQSVENGKDGMNRGE